MKKLKLGVLGAGNFFLKRYFEEITNEKRIELICICRKNKKILEQISKFTGVKKIYTNHKTMLEKEKLDIVMITSPHSMHFKHINDSLKKNCNIIVEKPLVTSNIDNLLLKRKLKKNKKKIISIYNPPYESHLNQVRNLVNSKSFGKLEYVNIFWSDNKKEIFSKNKNNSFFKTLTENFRYKNNNFDGGILFDSGSHLIAELLWVTKKIPKIVYATSEKKLKAMNINVTFEFNDSLLANITIIGESKNKLRKFESSYWSGNKKITVNGRPEKIIFEDFSKNKFKIYKNFPKINNPINEITNYIINGTKPRLSIKTSHDVVSVLNAIQESFFRKKKIKIKY